MSRFTSDDRFLWVIVGVGLLTAYRVIPATLHYVRDLTEVHEKPEDEVKKLKTDAEAALTPETLQILADGPSYELRSAAIRIVATRCLNNITARKILLRDLASKDVASRIRATDALWLILDFAALKKDGKPNGRPLYAEKFCDLAGFTAIIDALVNCLPLHADYEDAMHVPDGSEYPPPSPIKPPSRDPQEESLIAMLGILLKQHSLTSTNLAIPLAAGLVARWLNHYPFPCAAPLNARYGFRRSDTFFLFRNYSWGTDDVVMASVMQHLDRDPEALKQLRQCGLRASNYTEALTRPATRHIRKFDSYTTNEEPDILMARHDILMTNSEDTAGVNLDYPPLSPTSTNRPGSSWARRPPERSPEEESLRRRHREAIVVADRGTPLSRDNILQRQNSRVGPTPLLAQDPGSSHQSTD